MRTLRFISSLILTSCCFLLATIWFMPKVEPELARSIVSQKHVARTMAPKEPKQNALKGTKSEVTIKNGTLLERPSYTSKESGKKIPKVAPPHLARTQRLKSAKDGLGSPDFGKSEEYRGKGRTKDRDQVLPLEEKDPLKEAESALISLDKIFN